MSAQRPNRGLALVTGASSGIGEAFARRLAESGRDLILVARRRARLEELARALRAARGIEITVLEADLSREEDLERVRQVIVDDPRLDLLVNSAGFGTRDTFVELEESRTVAMIQLHVVAPVTLTRAALPAMIAAGRGRIINVSSLAAFFTTSRYVTYSATKAYLNMFTEGLRDELAGTGVRVQAVCAGLTRTGFFDHPELRGFRYQRVPSAFWMSADQVAELALASGEAIVVPGLHNRLLVSVLRLPVVGRALKSSIAVLAKRIEGLY